MPDRVGQSPPPQTLSLRVRCSAQYWVVDRDAAQTVTLHRLSGDGTYEARARMPLAWLLQTAPTDHLG
ncbi:hypothetical protein ACIBEF_05250 [Micromonospora sp. NPDC050795]|uniref:hypothetical protein n=1 Tax=Micromonospora sp. NPDC050795 TaxID=3364282 RepID=UPI00378A43B9